MGFGLIGRGTTPLLTPKQLAALGVSSVSYPRMLTSAALRGMQNALAAFGELIEAPETIERPDLLVPFDELNRLMGLDALNALEDRLA
jgi:2-methylisocitrate lyase-like PEP mutase family enzyme